MEYCFYRKVSQLRPFFSVPRVTIIPGFHCISNSNRNDICFVLYFKFFSLSEINLEKVSEKNPKFQKNPMPCIPLVQCFSLYSGTCLIRQLYNPEFPGSDKISTQMIVLLCILTLLNRHIFLVRTSVRLGTFHWSSSLLLYRR